MANDKALRQHVVNLLKGGNAHVDFDSAFKDLPAELRGKRPKGAEHSPWELLEHLRIAQWDILEFLVTPNTSHRSSQAGTGQARRHPRMTPLGAKASDPSARTFRRCAI